MISENFVLIRIYSAENYYLIRRLTDNNIFYSDLKDEKKFISLKIKYEQVNAVKSLFGTTNVKIIRFYGPKFFVSFFKKHYLFLLFFMWGIFLLFVLSNTIFEIEIVTTNNEMAKIILKELSESGIKKYRFKKSFEKLNLIKKDILENNKETLEWIEIDNVGTKYIINFTPRIIPKEKDVEKPQNIVSSKDAIIMHIEADTGEILKKNNEYVKKGDVIISGSIMKNEETLSAQVKASGKVYGEVWYTVNTTIPYNYIEYKPTGEVINHYFLEVFGKQMTLLGKFDTKFSVNEKEVLVDKPYLFFKVVKEKKEIYEYKEVKVSKEEALEEAINRSVRRVEVKLNDKEHIIDKKVLKIERYSSKISIEVFFKVYEDITQTSILEEIKEESIE